MTKVLESYGITPEQFVALAKLSEEEGISQKQLAQKLDKDQNTVKAILDKLVRHGYVERLYNVKDKRAFSLHLTEKARAALPALRELDAECLQIIYGKIDKERLQALAAVLREFRDNVSSKVQE